VYSDFARSKTDAQVVPFLALLAEGFSRKRVLFTEFGNPTCRAREDVEGGFLGQSTHDSSLRAKTFECLSEDEMAAYCTEALNRLHAAGHLGAYWWCWADYDERISREPPFDLAPHELTFGLIRGDGSEKPVARALAEFARQRREVVIGAAAATPNESTHYEGLPHSTAVEYATYLRANT
jgi:hypothetical protein